MKKTVVAEDGFVQWQKQHRAFGIGMAIFTLLGLAFVAVMHAF